MGVQHRFIMADKFKRISGVLGLDHQKLRDFFNLRDLKYAKIDAKNFKINKSNPYCTNPLDYHNFSRGTMAHPAPIRIMHKNSYCMLEKIMKKIMYKVE